MKEITARSNETIKEWAKLLKSARERRRQRLFLAEGEVLLEEALDSGAAVSAVLVCRDGQMPMNLMERAQRAGAELYRISRPVLEALSDVETPQGLIFLCRMPCQDEKWSGRRIILLDGVKDPGNLGTILRTADAFSVDRVLCCETADPYSPKVVRASMGALFRQKITVCSLDMALNRLEEISLPLLATALHRDSVQLGNAPLGECAIAIGNEAGGVSRQTLDACRGTLYIPMKGRAESLNAAVAAGIVMWEMAKEVGACP